MTSSKIMRLSFLTISLPALIFLSACSTNQQTRDYSYKNSLYQSSYYVERYGQVIGKPQTQYLNTIRKRLLADRVKAIKPELDFKLILLNSQKPMAFSAGNGYILLSTGLVLSFHSEAELAFAIAHEMAHHYLAHELDYKTMPEEDFIETNEKYELEADYMAVGMIAFAGYDPRYAAEALKNSYARGKLNLIEVKGYPDLQARLVAIYRYIDKSGWMPPGTVDRRDFQSFKKSLL